ETVEPAGPGRRPDVLPRDEGRRSDPMSELPHAILQLGCLGIVLGSLEWCFPNRAEQRRLRPQLGTDLAFYFGQHLVWLSLELAGLLAVRAALATVMPASITEAFGEQPWPAQAAELLIAGDLLTYWYHRASHAVPWLW